MLTMCWNTCWARRRTSRKTRQLDKPASVPLGEYTHKISLMRLRADASALFSRFSMNRPPAHSPTHLVSLIHLARKHVHDPVRICALLFHRPMRVYFFPEAIVTCRPQLGNESYVNDCVRTPDSKHQDFRSGLCFFRIFIFLLQERRPVRISLGQFSGKA